jgi:hypothetical protein
MSPYLESTFWSSPRCLAPTALPKTQQKENKIPNLHHMSLHFLPLLRPTPVGLALFALMPPPLWWARRCRLGVSVPVVYSNMNPPSLCHLGPGRGFPSFASPLGGLGSFTALPLVLATLAPLPLDLGPSLVRGGRLRCWCRGRRRHLSIRWW